MEGNEPFFAILADEIRPRRLRLIATKLEAAVATGTRDGAIKEAAPRYLSFQFRKPSGRK
jgi:hypothetical protein